MTADPQLIRSEAHVEIGQLLQRDAGLVIERWSRRAIAEQVHARRLHAEALRDDLPWLLEQVGQSLIATSAEETNGHCQPAARHGEQRWENGWSLTEVIRDYQILRLVVLEYLEETLDRPVRAREIMALGLALDEAISTSVHRYVQHHDDYIRRIEHERAENEKQLRESLHQRQAAALQEINRRKDEFLAILGHELRNPLAPIRNAVYVLQERGSDPATLQWSQGVLERQTRHLTRLVDDLLDVARLGQGKIRLRREPLDLTALVQATAGDHRSTLEASSLTLDLRLPDGPVWVVGDATRLAQVLGNLLANAAKFTDAGGCVTILLTADPQQQRATVIVQDSGIGMEPDMLKRVFEAFMQADRTLDRSRGGLGVGLALVRGLVGLHAGEVAAHSDGLGHGSTFTFWLPLAPAAPPSGEPPPEASTFAEPT